MLVALLRIAERLESGHRRMVGERLRWTSSDGQAIFRVQMQNGARLDVAGLTRKAAMFEREFGLRPVFRRAQTKPKVEGKWPKPMILYLVRHGIAIDREDSDCPPETERYLTRDGIKKTREVAKGIRGLKVEPSLMITSPYVRSAQTAEIFAEALGYSREKIRQSRRCGPEAIPRIF